VKENRDTYSSTIQEIKATDKLHVFFIGNIKVADKVDEES
jgi:hypothetical protein